VYENTGTVTANLAPGERFKELLRSAEFRHFDVRVTDFMDAVSVAAGASRYIVLISKRPGLLGIRSEGTS